MFYCKTTFNLIYKYGIIDINFIEGGLCMEGLLTFITITLLIIIVPGPDFLIVTKNTINGGKMNGIMAALGISSAHIVYSSLAIFGIIYINKFILFIFNN